jgi:type IV secretion system protein VirB1
MLPVDFIALAQQCAPQVSPVTMAAIVRTESGFNPYAIGVIHGVLLRQPASLDEAVSTARALAAGGWNFSAGLAQVNHANWPLYGLSEQTAFDPCRNLAAGAAILQGCFELAERLQPDARHDAQLALRAGLSCYASGNFSTGYRTGYVQRVVNSAQMPARSPVPVVVPSIAPLAVFPVDSNIAPKPVRSPPGDHPRSDPVMDTSPAGLGRSAVVF